MVDVRELAKARTDVDAEERRQAKLRSWLGAIGISISHQPDDQHRERAIDCLACCSDCSFSYCTPGHPMCGHICYDNCCGTYCWDNCIC